MSKSAVGHMRSSESTSAVSVSSPGSRSVGSAVSADFMLCTLCKKPCSSSAELMSHMTHDHGGGSSAQMSSPSRAANPQLPSPSHSISQERDNPTPLGMSTLSICVP